MSDVSFSAAGTSSPERPRRRTFALRDRVHDGTLWALLFCVLAAASGCGSGSPSPADRATAVTTVAPFAMILRPLLEPEVRAETLLRAGTTPHSYDPRPSDLRTVEGSRVLVFGSPLLDAWAAALPNRHSLRLVDLLPDSLLRHPPGTARETRVPDADHADPHFWTDPLAVRALLPTLTDTLCTLEVAPCARLRDRARTFAAELTELHREVRETVAPARGRPVLLAQPFFGFFLRRYGIPVAGVVQPAPGHEAGPRHVERLILVAREKEVRLVLASAAESPRAAEIVARESGARVVTVPALGASEEIGGYRDLILVFARTLRDALADQPVTDA